MTVIATIHSVTTAAPQLGQKSQLLGLGHFRARVNRKGKQAAASGGGGVLFEFSSIKLRNLALLPWSHSQGRNQSQTRKLLPIIPL